MSTLRNCKYGGSRISNARTNALSEANGKTMVSTRIQRTQNHAFADPTASRNHVGYDCCHGTASVMQASGSHGTREIVLV